MLARAARSAFVHGGMPGVAAHGVLHVAKLDVIHDGARDGAMRDDMLIVVALAALAARRYRSRCGGRGTARRRGPVRPRPRNIIRRLVPTVAIITRVVAVVGGRAPRSVVPAVAPAVFVIPMIRRAAHEALGVRILRVVIEGATHLVGVRRRLCTVAMAPAILVVPPARMRRRIAAGMAIMTTSVGRLPPEVLVVVHFRHAWPAIIARLLVRASRPCRSPGGSSPGRERPAPVPIVELLFGFAEVDDLGRQVAARASPARALALAEEPILFVAHVERV
mmetsp:Transcript_6424/g.18119  ORF Transcript_6424/g.18119 Transcript_6424/m.18119 type:complete len:278 (+) Transcript_6424:1749-2582(+)